MERFCDYGKRARMWTSWTDDHPGMSFFGCPNWKVCVILLGFKFQEFGSKNWSLIVWVLVNLNSFVNGPIKGFNIFD